MSKPGVTVDEITFSAVCGEPLTIGHSVTCKDCEAGLHNETFNDYECLVNRGWESSPEWLKKEKIAAIKKKIEEEFGVFLPTPEEAKLCGAKCCYRGSACQNEEWVTRPQHEIALEELQDKLTSSWRDKQVKLKARIERAKEEYGKFGEERINLMNQMVSSKERVNPEEWQKSFDANEKRTLEARGYIEGLETAYHMMGGE